MLRPPRDIRNLEAAAEPLRKLVNTAPPQAKMLLLVDCAQVREPASRTNFLSPLQRLTKYGGFPDLYASEAELPRMVSGRAFKDQQLLCC